jgi:hypothetical protein
MIAANRSTIRIGGFRMTQLQARVRDGAYVFSLGPMWSSKLIDGESRTSSD